MSADVEEKSLASEDTIEEKKLLNMLAILIIDFSIAVYYKRS